MSTGGIITISPSLSFVDTLAERMLTEYADVDPLTFSRLLILLPNRRACRALQEAFLRQTKGRPLLLPSMQPLGDLDEDALFFASKAVLDLPPAIPSLRRRLLLARLIFQGKFAGLGSVKTLDQAMRLAVDLARLLDEVQREQLDFEALQTLAPEEYAEHWQQILQFLKIVTQFWPDILREEGCMDPVARRNALIEAQAQLWERSPPDFPIIAAGSTGSIPATARLLKVIAGLPNGHLVLPGLDTTMDEESWSVLKESHPQYGLKALLETLGVTRSEVAVWGDGTTPREMLISEVMRSAETMERWRCHTSPPPEREGIRRLSRLDLVDQQEEAATIALMMRACLETPGKTAALVTHDRSLARRVAVGLERYGIAVDDSAGTPLSLTPPGVFMRLIAEMVASRAAPTPLLALFKHPLSAGSLPPGVFRSHTRMLELRVLRGLRPASGFDGLLAALAACSDAKPLQRWLHQVARLCDPFFSLFENSSVPLAKLIEAHIQLAERLAETDVEKGAARLWTGDFGQALSDFLRTWLESSGYAWITRSSCLFRVV